MQEHIAANSFDLMAGDVVLNIAESMKHALDDAVIQDVVFVTMQARTIACPDHMRCLLCKTPNIFWQTVPLCEECHMQQIRILHEAEQANGEYDDHDDDGDDDGDDAQANAPAGRRRSS